MPKPPPDDEVKRLALSPSLSIREAAKVYGLSERLLRRAVDDGRVGHLKLGPSRNGPIRIPRASLEEWLVGSYRPPKPEQTEPPRRSWERAKPQPPEFVFPRARTRARKERERLAEEQRLAEEKRQAKRGRAV